MSTTIEDLFDSIEDVASEAVEAQQLLYTVEDELLKLKRENKKLRELVSHLMYVKPAEVTAITHDGKLLRFDEMLAEVGMRFEVENGMHEDV